VSLATTLVASSIDWVKDSLKFSLDILEKSNVAVSPGVGFGKFGEGYIRIALVENKQRIRQAMKNIKAAL